MIVGDFESIVTHAIHCSLQHRKTNAEQLKWASETLHPAAFAREFCTIHIDMGRQTGKSTYIKQHAKKGDIIVALSYEAKNRQYADTLATVFTPQQIDDERFLMSLRGKPSAPFVYIDEPELVERGCELQRIFAAFASGSIDQTFVLLGH